MFKVVHVSTCAHVTVSLSCHKVRHGPIPRRRVRGPVIYAPEGTFPMDSEPFPQPVSSCSPLAPPVPRTPRERLRGLPCHKRRLEAAPPSQVASPGPPSVPLPGWQCVQHHREHPRLHALQVSWQLCRRTVQLEVATGKLGAWVEGGAMTCNPNIFTANGMSQETSQPEPDSERYMTVHQTPQ